eukprot:g18350.t1
MPAHIVLLGPSEQTRILQQQLVRKDITPTSPVVIFLFVEIVAVQSVSSPTTLQCGPPPPTEMIGGVDGWRSRGQRAATRASVQATGEAKLDNENYYKNETTEPGKVVSVPIFLISFSQTIVFTDAVAHDSVNAFSIFCFGSSSPPR